MPLQPLGMLALPPDDALRTRFARAPYDRLWARLEQRTRATIAAARASQFALATGAIGWHSRTPSVLAAALLARVRGDADALRYVEECLAFVERFQRETVTAGKHGPLIHSHAELAIAAAVLGDRLPAATRTRLLAFMRTVAIDCRAGADCIVRYSGGNNIRWCHNVQAAVCALLWGEACGHPAWRQVVDDAILHTRCYVKYGCDEGGYSFEGTGYGHGVFHVMFVFLQLLKERGYADLFAEEPRLRQIFEAMLHSMFPDGTYLTNDNDVGLGGAASLSYLLFAHRAYGEPLYLGLWQAYQGPTHPLRPYGDMRPWLATQFGNEAPEGTPDDLHALFYAAIYWDADATCTPVVAAPRPTQHVGRGTARVDLRTSWGPDAVFVNLLGAGRSHVSQTHRHADAGHFSLVAHGDYLAIDTGRYNSDEDQHSVMLVDGKCHLPVAPGWGMDFLSGRLAQYSTFDRMAYVRFDAAHEKGCFWADRHFLFVPYAADDAYLVALDNVNQNNARHAFWWQLQVHPEAKITIADERHATVAGPHARLDLTFAIPPAADFPQDPHMLALRQDVKDWHWPYGREQDTAFLQRSGLLSTSVERPRLIAELTGLNGVMLALISPRRNADAPLAVTVREQQRLLWVEVAAGEYRDTIVAALDHGVIAAPEFSAMTELAFVRRDAAGRVLLQWTADGSPLRWRK